MENTCGTLSFTNEKLKFVSEGYGKWEVLIHEIKLIAEYTTGEGPLVEDHFIVLWGNAYSCFEVPFGASGVENSLKYIESILNVEITPKLVFETTLKSRVIYPSKYKEYPYWEVVDKINQCSGFKKLLNKIKNANAESLKLSPTVRKFIESNNPEEQRVQPYNLE